jgi:hypothetical protein
MIVYNLGCEDEHRFEGWFASPSEFDRQSEAGLVECPVCGSFAVKRLPTASYVNKGVSRGVERGPAEERREGRLEELAQRIAGMLEQVLRDTEDVGAEFSEEARRIHYKEAPARSIRGIASNREVEELREEGIDVMVVPVAPQPPENLH